MAGQGRWFDLFGDEVIFIFDKARGSGLTGAELQDLLQFANRDNTVEEARWAHICLILYANESGQPSGQDLTQSQDQTPTTSANPVNVQMSGDIVQSSGDNNNNGTNKRKRDDLEDRIANPGNTTREEVVKNLKEKIHHHLSNWKDILVGTDDKDILKWLINGVDATDFFRYFKGNFKGRFYDSDIPPNQYFQNSKICKQHVDFISKELCEKIAMGSVKLLGAVGECEPPRIVMPLTVEPSKPRLCHDERFLNLWVKDLPFHLETLKDIPRLVQKDALMVTYDEKSGYDHVKLSQHSFTYFGIQFGGFYMTYTTLPFGWKASPFIYQSIGMCVTSYLRKLNVLNTLYIDDRFSVTRGGPLQSSEEKEFEGRRLVYVMLEVLTRLGYTLSLKKCSLVPEFCKKFLGFFVDSEKQAFILPEDKRKKFIELREFILSSKEVDLRTLQRFSGKCISMQLAVPGCDNHLTMGDYWLADDTRPIHEKEAEAILKALQSLGKSLLDSRVDVLTDSMAVIGAWNSQGSKCPALNCIMKDIFQLVAGQNVDLHLSFVPSELNKADGPSRILNTADTMLSNASWVLVDSRFGPHTVDLMSLDSNVMQSVDSRPLRHFTPWLTPETSGVNVFSQDLKAESNMYVYPPYVLIFPLLCFLKEQSVSCTVVVPELYPVPMWWPMLTSCSSTSILLGARGQKGVVKAPSRKGFVVDEFGLRWPLWAFRINSDIDLEKIEGRMDELDKRITCSSGHKRKKSFQGSFLQFLQDLDCKHLSVCTPDDIRRFLIWKDFSGKTTIHGVHCKHLGQKGEFDCFCPKRLASGTVEGVINQLVNIFDDNGFGRYWDIFSKSGNPACAPIVKEYLKLIREEQASAHVLPKQAKPIFLSKIKAMCSYIDREIKSPGDRASDLSLVVAQEVKVLNDNSGLVFQHTFGKTLRGDKGKSNTFVIKKCDDLSICPVQGLLDYVNFCQVSTVDMSVGYLFRIVSEKGRVLDKAVNYSVMYERLRYYLSLLGIYEGETPHSFRSGCAVTMALSGAAENVDQAMKHIGWFGRTSAEYYSRIHTLVDAGSIALRLSQVANGSENIETVFKEQADYSSLVHVFNKE
ncbi:unnamed protein product [Mytilus edulis]|uniref:Reverse transcriptase domain-containing protein n=1 Tax=Mytilus edulis TaxID=6550 RepID=A0A8S3R5M0_MYTED|nr:unnamed protein product [Mytilus edulis]